MLMRLCVVIIINFEATAGAWGQVLSTMQDSFGFDVFFFCKNFGPKWEVSGLGALPAWPCQRVRRQIIIIIISCY